MYIKKQRIALYHRLLVYLIIELFTVMDVLNSNSRINHCIGRKYDSEWNNILSATISNYEYCT